MILQNVTCGFEPKRVLAFFEQICKIPHGSYNEEKIADYLQSFANMRGLYCFRDAKNNVLIKLPATEKYKDSPAVLLQGHTDMVCEKTSESKHDFERDGLDLYIENGFLRARGTTLGGDDGIAVAMMLALLDGELEEHPALECLFTVEEEVGLGGAEAFDYKKIDARRMINLDSESEGEVVAGCAGGVRSKITYKPSAEETDGEFVSLCVDGLFGGHSGVDINVGRTNAIVLTVNILNEIKKAQNIRVVSLEGGDKDNAIPRSCRAVFYVENSASVFEAIKKYEESIRPMLCSEDKDLKISAEILQKSQKAFLVSDTHALLDLLSSIKVGVLNMSADLDGLVEFSRNLGVIKANESGVSIVYSSRSAKEEQVDLSMKQIEEAAKAVGGAVSHKGRYPGWDFAPDSDLRDIYIKKYREIMGKEVNTVVIHAGLECGIIKSKLPDMDIISVGPDIQNIHTPDEALDLASTDRVFEVLKAVLVS